MIRLITNLHIALHFLSETEFSLFFKFEIDLYRGLNFIIFNKNKTMTPPESSSSSPLFQIYNASAGAGKTYTLTQNYICNLLSDQFSFRKILAITFTNKAVAEMKSRIIEKLHELSFIPGSDQERAYRKEITIKTGLSEDEVRKKSVTILKGILHNYAAFEVSTIDGFNHRLLRTFAQDLGIPMNFEVEIDTDQVLEEAVDRVLAKIGTPGQKNLTQATVRFAMDKVDDDRSWDISFDLNEIAKLLVNDNNVIPLEKLSKQHLSSEDFALFNKQLTKEINTLSQQCQKAAENFFTLINQNGLIAKNFSRQSIPKFFQKTQQKDFQVYAPNDKPLWAINIDNPDYTKHYKKKEDESIKRTMDQLRPEIAELYREVEQQTAKIQFYKKILQGNPSLALLSAISKEVSAIKQDRDLLLISEFNQTISKSLQGENPAFIYERLGEKYSTFYIDEFQDTSEMQWGNLQPLIENSLAEGGQLTIVGDVKQSIYRWRGGKAEQFMTLWAADNPLVTKRTLAHNYRSRSEIVKLNNAFFKQAAASLEFPPYKTLFEKAGQKPVRKKGGYVNIQFVEAQKKEEKEEVYPQQVLKIIKDQKDKGYPFQDMCILVRKKNQGIAIADYLSHHSIPLVSSETLLLAHSPTINFIIALLRFSLQPKDDNLKFEILNALYEKNNFQTSFYEFVSTGLQNDGDQLFNFLHDYGFEFHLKTLQIFPIYDAVENCIRAFDLQNNKREVAYLQFFLDVVYEYAQSHIGGISGFIELWDSKKGKLSITSAEEAKGVQIMTIHKAKGLSFPIVIYPFAEEKLDDTSKDSVWIPLDEPFNKIPVTYQKVNSKLPLYGEKAKTAYERIKYQTELDTLNVSYVAMTRPEEKLFILSNHTPSKKKTSNENPKEFSKILINFLKQEQLWDENKADQRYEFGINQVKTKKEPKDHNSSRCEINLNSFVSSSPKQHAVHVVTKSGVLWESGDKKALQEGTLIHQFLEHIIQKSDLSATLREAVFNGEISSDEQKQYRDQLKSIIQHPKLTPYFSNDYQIYTEKEILINKEYKRLDRLCLQGNKAVIIDYKTGAPHPQYIKQINTYGQAIKTMGYTVVKKLLVYINKEELYIKEIT